MTSRWGKRDPTAHFNPPVRLSSTSQRSLTQSHSPTKSHQSLANVLWPNTLRTPVTKNLINIFYFEDLWLLNKQRENYPHHPAAAQEEAEQQ